MQIEKVRNTTAKIKGIISRFRLTPGLTYRIHITAVHSTMLYNIEI